jgi:hypothetical protein
MMMDYYKDTYNKKYILYFGLVPEIYSGKWNS